MAAVISTLCSIIKTCRSGCEWSLQRWLLCHTLITGALYLVQACGDVHWWKSMSGFLYVHEVCEWDWSLWAALVFTVYKGIFLLRRHLNVNDFELFWMVCTLDFNRICKIQKKCWVNATFLFTVHWIFVLVGFFFDHIKTFWLFLTQMN